MPRLKPAICDGNIKKFRNLWYDLQLILNVYKNVRVRFKISLLKYNKKHVGGVGQSV
jgi:hypothetical protein